ncbi:hypothetical protein GCM10011531_09770 [Aquaticitalea lipolytica]|uniref:Uncharacterized protein n=1 Tax=Aquaticitalea lipolytica TaxID=1247562 RepID=A0A8J2TQ49_9FLAO|nr:hypothetical protein [Aquaticitalea lipolytica]GFZ81585.1 hypothetical protein GCM10011531_09770 [Aquaticitalea lipolytica]
MYSNVKVNRRKFLKTDALAIGDLIRSGYSRIASKGKNVAKAMEIAHYTPNAFIKIGTDNFVYKAVNHNEIGQDKNTTINQLIGDEMEVPWKNICTEHAQFDAIYNPPSFVMQHIEESAIIQNEEVSFTASTGTELVLFYTNEESKCYKWGMFSGNQFRL